mmetsp:Transcript_13072/g.19098  ORF Transcript_13072/g.19098 Transcript_13072/m.19098 type:complete len:159 (+) Transcript_13072:833-1309(+)
MLLEPKWLRTDGEDDKRGDPLPGVVADHSHLEQQPALQAAEVSVPAAVPKQAQDDLHTPSTGNGQRGTVEFQVVLDKAQGQKLGVDVAFDDDERMFFIEKIFEGLVMSWNTSHPENAIQEGDHVYEVNGITGSAIEMAEACKKDSTLRMSIRRYGHGP